MPLAMMAGLGAVMLGTAFLSGVFGMAGGMILIGVLLALMPLPAAMALHAVTQMASNFWRALLWRRHVVWRSAAAYGAGCLVALAGWACTGYVPPRPLALLMLGATPFLARLAPPAFRPDAENPAHGAAYGAVCMTLLLLTGVAGPLVDMFFLGGRLDRRQVVATKSACQVFGHAVKLVYFAGLIDQAAAVDPALAALGVAASMLGTSLARRLLEAMSDATFRRWAGRIITAIAGWYVAQGTWLLLAG
jgi:uncharacterized membrane protein YfcA